MRARVYLSVRTERALIEQELPFERTERALIVQVLPFERTEVHPNSMEIPLARTEGALIEQELPFCSHRGRLGWLVTYDT